MITGFYLHLTVKFIVLVGPSPKSLKGVHLNFTRLFLSLTNVVYVAALLSSVVLNKLSRPL